MHYKRLWFSVPYSDSTMNSFDVLTPTLYWFILLYNSNSIILNVYLKTICENSITEFSAHIVQRKRDGIFTKCVWKGKAVFNFLSLFAVVCLRNLLQEPEEGWFDQRKYSNIIYINWTLHRSLR